MKIELGKKYKDIHGHVWIVEENKGYSDAPFRGYCSALCKYVSIWEDGSAVNHTNFLMEEAMKLELCKKYVGEDGCIWLIKGNLFVNNPNAPYIGIDIDSNDKHWRCFTEDGVSENYRLFEEYFEEPNDTKILQFLEESLRNGNIEFGYTPKAQAPFTMINHNNLASIGRSFKEVVVNMMRKEQSS